MNGYIKEPKRIPLLLRIVIAIVEKSMKKRMTPARMLAWYPRAAVGAGMMEGLVAHDEKEVPKRLLQLLRMQVSISSSCPFCIDMNSKEYTGANITNNEILALQGGKPFEQIKTFSPAEITALEYAKALTSTPIRIKEPLIEALAKQFSPRGIVIIVSTVAQVNFWARLIQGLGLPPLGFSPDCPVLNLESYGTLIPDNGEKQ
ncbi:MAG: carboxymuconolactone decarboxylase family protein [Spirochaetales bacterium]|nr:carboxymuconolactone decarboxylase family protein [Spirochaetales bacterium]